MKKGCGVAMNKSVLVFAYGSLVSWNAWVDCWDGFNAPVFYKFCLLPRMAGERLLSNSKPTERPGCWALPIGYVTAHYRGNW